MDKLFLFHQMPRLNEFLFYRILDVSSVKMVVNVKKPDLFFKKKNSHRALDDIRESIGELQHYIKYAFKWSNYQLRGQDIKRLLTFDEILILIEVFCSDRSHLEACSRLDLEKNVLLLCLSNSHGLFEGSGIKNYAWGLSFLGYNLLDLENHLNHMKLNRLYWIFGNVWWYLKKLFWTLWFCLCQRSRW